MKLMEKFFGIVFTVVLLSGFVYQIGQATELTPFQIELLPWEKANTQVPRYAKFTVIDIDTNKQFRVQRRAGSQHADVQPLTKKDTKIMKGIYGGNWSWKRRAILVLYEDRLIAASMHGMPHGAGALENDFPGHFCIHFIGSTTHRTDKMDLSHKLMVLKSAGELERFLQSVTINHLITAFIVGVKQHDRSIVSKTATKYQSWEKIFANIDQVELKRLDTINDNEINGKLTMSLQAEIEWYIKDVGPKMLTVEIKLIRPTPFEQWKIDADDFIQENELL